MGRLNRGRTGKREQSRKQYSRREDTINQRLLVMIACEGERTERLYFDELFRNLKSKHTISKLSCVIAPHNHTNPSGVLDDLLGHVTPDGKNHEDYEEKWIVIDRDEERTNGGGHTKQDFMNAIERARKYDVGIAWSNPSFEIWYLLHYEYRNSGIDRDEVTVRLSEHLERPYRKNDTALYSELEGKRDTAIRHANRLLKDIENMGISPADANPGTKVVVLVEKLLEYGRED